MNQTQKRYMLNRYYNPEEDTNHEKIISFFTNIVKGFFTTIGCLLFIVMIFIAGYSAYISNQRSKEIKFDIQTNDYIIDELEERINSLEKFVHQQTKKEKKKKWRR